LTVFLSSLVGSRITVALFSGAASDIALLLTRALFHRDGACLVRTLVVSIPESAGDTPVGIIGHDVASFACKNRVNNSGV
jgi:hypothetical protein